MTNYDVSNFHLSDPQFDVGKITDTKWINDGSATDLSINLVESTFLGFNKPYNEKVEQSWDRLSKRAEENLPKDGPFSFYNSKVLNWEGLIPQEDSDSLINVSKGIFYKTVASVRSSQELYDELGENKPCAFVIVSAIITSDNKLVFGRRKYYGDWPYNTYECSGAFLNETDLDSGSLTETAKQKIRQDYGGAGELKSIPLIIYHLPRILETILLCVSKTSLSSEEMKSDYYSEVFCVENSLNGFNELKKIPLDQFHPPSRVVIQTYFKHFALAQEMLNKLN